MITWTIRIVALTVGVACFMSAHWIWGIILLVIGLTFYARGYYGEVL
jgi:hypothetical protein